MLEVYERCSEGIIVLFTLTIFYMCAADHFRTKCSKMESKRPVVDGLERKTRDRKAVVLCQPNQGAIPSGLITTLSSRLCHDL